MYHLVHLTTMVVNKDLLSKRSKKQMQCLGINEENY